MDDLSNIFHECTIGCNMGVKIINNCSYADDLCIIEISTSGMQKLLNICSDYGN